MRNQLFDKLAGLVVVTIYSGVFVVDGQMPVPNWGFDNNARFRLCSSEVCNETRNILTENINSSIGACDDFYVHVCNGWRKNIPAEKQSRLRNRLRVLEIKAMRQLKELISTPEVSDIEAVRKAKILYDSCVNLDAIEKRGIRPIEDLVFSNGGWPLATPAENRYRDNASLSFHKILTNYVKMGARSPFFSVGLVTDSFNDCGYELMLNYELNPYGRQIYPGYQRVKRENFYGSYLNYIKSVGIEMATSRGMNDSLQIQRDVMNILKFERALIRDGAERFTGTSERLTIRELQKLWDEISILSPAYSINWLEMISSYFDGTGIVIDSYQKIIVGTHSLKLWAKLLNETPLRTTINYIQWVQIEYLSPFANQKTRDIANEFVKREKKLSIIKDRATFCINQNQMEHALSYMYVRKYFSKEDKITVNDMVSEIQAEMRQHFMDSLWMDTPAIQLAVNKVDTMKKNIGYPDWYDEEGRIDEYYDKLKIGPHFIDNVLNVRKFKQIQEFKAFPKPRYQNKHFTNSFEVYGKYDPVQNFLDIPAARFQMAFSHPELPVFMLYGGVGSAIAREIIRGIYTEARISGEYHAGKLMWNNATSANYLKKISCLSAQYYNQNYNGSIDHRNFSHVIDLTGFTIGVRAYLSYKNNKKPQDFNIPILNNYTDEQLFFYGLTNTLCDDLRGLYDHVFPLWAPYVTVSGALSNMAEFSEAFNCPYGSRMNPVVKCTL